MELKWAAVLGLSAKRIEGKIDLILRLGDFGEAQELKKAKLIPWASN